jgi:putative DNA primase/helicase
VDWHPDAGEPEAIDDFLHDIVEPGDVPTLYRLIAHTLYKEYLGEKAAILIGSGSNGKSMFLSLIESFIGSYNVAHRELQDFDDDGFAANNLQGKLANLATEIGEQAIDNATTFKKLTGRDSIQARVKFEKPVKFENYASLMFATNEMPVFGQDNHAIWRRWVYVDFPHTFDADDPAAKDPEPERVLKDRLFAEAEFEALLVRCQQEIQRWYEGEPFFAGAMDADEVRDKMKKAAEPVYAFGSACLEAADDEGDFVERSVVRAAYKAFADEQDLPRVAENEFGKRLLALRDYSIESTQKRVDGHPTGVYEGIQLSSRGRQVLGVDEPDDDQQTVEDRPPAKPLVLEQAREMFEANDHEAVPKDGLAWACAGDIGKSSAEHAIEELLHQGDLYEPEGGFVRPT